MKPTRAWIYYLICKISEFSLWVSSFFFILFDEFCYWKTKNGFHAISICCLNSPLSKWFLDADFVVLDIHFIFSVAIRFGFFIAKWLFCSELRSMQFSYAIHIQNTVVNLNLANQFSYEYFWFSNSLAFSIQKLKDSFCLLSHSISFS